MSLRKVAMDRRSGNSSEPSSASLAQAERKINLLEAENLKLKEELADVKSMYIQLTKEGRHEKFDERRVQFLKAQLVQLERQLLLLNDALGARMSVVLEAENAFQEIVNRCRQCQNQEGRIGGFFISKEELERIVEMAESARLKLFKNLENTSMQRLHRPIQFMDTFIKHGDFKKCTLLDICSGELSHLNLKQVGKLESKLSQVYGQLQRVNHCLTLHLFPDDSQTDSGRCLAPNANYIRMLGECSKACNMLNEVLPEMLELSVLVPAAPWPMLSKPIIKELTVDHVMQRMPAMTKTKAQEVTETISSLLKVLSLVQLKANMQEKAYRDELKFHKNVYDLQLRYIDDLFKALRVAYEQFETDTNELICEPLQRVLGIYQSLKKTAAEEALRKFLATFKEYEPQMSDAVEKLKKDESFKGQDEALSGYAKEFFTKLDDLQRKCDETRDENIDQLQDIKDQQKEYWAEIRKLMQDSYIEEPERDTNSSFANKRKPKEKLVNREWNSNVDVSRDDETCVEDSPYSQRDTRRASLTTPDQRPSPQPRKQPKNNTSKQKKPKNHGTPTPKPTTEIPNAQQESEALFKSMLRGGLDDGPGFVFNSIDTTVDPDIEPDDSANMYQDTADQRSHRKPQGANMYDNTAEHGFNRKPPGAMSHRHSGAGVSPSDMGTTGTYSSRRSKPPISGGKSSAGKLMPGVAHSRLVLKPIPIDRGVRSRSATPEYQRTTDWKT